MNFPWARHYQRYEYVMNRGWIDGKRVADFGCGLPAGANAMTVNAKMVYAVDPLLREFAGVKMGFFSPAGSDAVKRMRILPYDLFLVKKKFDVITAIEVFEHMPNPKKFVEHVAGHCKNAFLTTPLAERTARTINSSHVAEYSSDDFDDIVKGSFTIIEKLYQLGDMSVVKHAKADGCSMDDSHVVQMVWCRSKYGR